MKVAATTGNFIIALTVDPKRVAELESLMEKYGIEKKDFANQSFSLFIWAIKEIAEGKTIASIDEKKKRWREVRLPIFSKVKRHSKK